MTTKLEQKDGLSVTRTASANLANAYRFVIELAAPNTEQVKQVDAANADALGLIDRTYKSGDLVQASLTGLQICEAGAAVAVGDLIVTDNVGRGVPKGAVATTHYKVQGRALSAAGAAGALFAMQMAKHDFYQA